MNIYKRVEQAIQNAPTHEAPIGSESDLSLYPERDDDAQIHFHAEPTPDLPNMVTLDIEHELGLKGLLSTFGDVVGGSFGQEYMMYAPMHEDQHFRAAQQLGAKSARVGIRVIKLQVPGKASELVVNPLTYMNNFRTTKLGAALITAHPLPPSRGDEVDIKGYGYSGVEELAEIAMRRNRNRQSTDLYYPVPLSFKSQETRRSFFLDRTVPTYVSVSPSSFSGTR